MSGPPSFSSATLAQDFCYTSKHVAKKGYCHDLDNLPVGDWSDVSKLSAIHVSQKTPPLPAASLKKWIKTFEKVSSLEALSPVAMFTFQLAFYLKSDEGGALYLEAYNLELSNKSLKRRRVLLFAPSTVTM